MFDISFVEIALVLLIALMVLGPERLPRAAKMVGLWLRRAKASWYSVKAEFERELADEELKRSLQQAQRDINEAKQDFEAATREPVDAVGEVGKATDEAASTLKQSLEEHETTSEPAPRSGPSSALPPSPGAQTEPGPGDVPADDANRRDPDPGKPGP
jgi:sec-independent protein translocase protein TatB